MADYVQIPEDGAGKKIRHRQRTIGADTVHTQSVILADSADPTIEAAVDATYGLATDVKRTTGLTDAQLRATAVPVSASSLPLPSGAASEASLAAAAASLAVVDDWDESDRAKVNPIVGQAGVAAGAGAVGATVQRVTLASDDPAVAALQAIDNAVAGNELQVDVVTSALPSGAATAAKQPALGTAGTPSADVLTVQGVTSMTALKVDGSAVTQPVSGPVTDAQLRASAVPVSLASVPSHPVTNAGTFATQAASAGDVAHDAVDSGAPVKIGAKAVAFGANPTAVAAGDRTDLYATRHGIQWVQPGHPNTLPLRANYTAAQTDTVIVSADPGQKIVVTRISLVLDGECTVKVAARVGFGATTTPTGPGVVASHPGIVPGSGIVEGNGGGTLGTGADGEDLRITSEAPTNGSLDVVLSYYLIES